MKAKFNYSEDKSNLHVICDTNVWYNISSGNYQKPADATLIATSLTLVELASSETMASALFAYQGVLKSIHTNSGPIIAVNPLDFVLRNHDPNYPVDHSETQRILEEFSKVMSSNIPEGEVLSESDKSVLIQNCKVNRQATVDFAEYATNELIQIRKNINKGVGKKEHQTIDTTEINREMMKSVLSEHAKKVNYTIDFETFDWGNLEFFMAVTENYFKKLELIKGMKVKPNDAVDWFNMLYVTSRDKYLTFEKSWIKLIDSDERSAKYRHA